MARVWKPDVSQRDGVAKASEVDEKAWLHERLAGLARGIAERTGVGGRVSLDAYIVSETSYGELGERYGDGGWSREEFAKRHILFRDGRGEYVERVLGGRGEGGTMSMTPAERVAQRTWSTLDLAQQLRTRFGEETLTDLLVLDMLQHRRAKGYWLHQTTRHEEHRWGADLFVIIRHPTGRSSRLALQAKKLYPDDRYRMLNSVTKSESQLNRLEQFARRYHALPLYLLYNHSKTADRSRHWHCRQSFVKDQLGCTLVPSWHIRRMLWRPPPPRNFDAAHSVRQSRPWRCAFDCPCAEGELVQMANRTPYRDSDAPVAYGWHFGPMEGDWPAWLFANPTARLSKEDMDRLRSDLSELNRQFAEVAPREITGLDEEWLYPARLLMFDGLEER